METIRRLTPSSSIEDILKASPEERKRWADDMIARSNQTIAEKIQNKVSSEWKYALLGMSAEVEMEFWKKISRKSRNVNKKYLTFDSSIEEVFAASPEEQDKWAEDIANRSNAFMELRKGLENTKVAIGV